MTRLSASLFWPIAALLLFLFVAALLLGGPELGFDRTVLLAAQQGAAVPAARLLTDAGAWWAVLVAGGAAAAFLAWRRRWRAAAALAVLLVTERLAVEQLKLIFDRARPDPAGHLTAVHTMAFPSGHAANAMALGLGLALLLPLGGRGRAVVLAVGLAYAAMIGWTRLALGVHWPSDVVGGWAMGALWTLLLVRLIAGTSAPRRH